MTTTADSPSWLELANAPIAYLSGAFSAIKERNKLQCPGPYENLHRELKNTLPTLHMIDGAKFDIASVMSPNFHVSHSFAWGSSQAPPTYHFSAAYQTKKYVLNGTVDGDGSLQARANYFWASAAGPTMPETPEEKPTEATHEPSFNRHQEHDHIGESLSLNLKAINPNPFDTPSKGAVPGGRTLSGQVPTVLTGVYSLSYLQSISRSWTVGTEVMLQRMRPEEPEMGYSFAARWAPPASPLPPPSSLPPGFPSPYMPVNPVDPTQSFTATYTPSQGIVHASYWRRLNQRLEVAAEVQMLITPGSAEEPGRREGVASAGFKLDTFFATIRGMVDSMGRVSALLEERMAPGLQFQLCGEIDYSKGQGGAGRVGLGFTLEA
ncbi:translocase of outer mitochondrial membrane [Blyttiomyces sp. JEL0837]|nr:translocase of outer mitochondrial membrane [Blyttiomyces sp. JEL0837]